MIRKTVFGILSLILSLSALLLVLNPQSTRAMTDDPGSPIIVINEVDADTAGTDTLEFVELYDGGYGNTSLDGLVVVFYNGNGDKSYAAYDLDGKATDADGYFLLGNAAVVPTPSMFFPNNNLENGADAVALHTGNATDFPNGTLVTTARLIDAIVYDTDDVDDPGLLILLNMDEPQVNENLSGKGSEHSNQRCPNGYGGTRNTRTYIQATPTPGAANVTEVCDGLDNDCDGLIDADDPSCIGTFPYYADADSDGLGDPAISVQACSAPTGYVPNSDDMCPDVPGSSPTGCIPELPVVILTSLGMLSLGGFIWFKRRQTPPKPTS